MNRKRSIVVCGIVVSIACVLLITYAVLPARPGVTKTNYDRIELGMTKADVAAIMGKPGFSQPDRIPDSWVEMWQHAGMGHACVITYRNDGVGSMRWTDSKETVTETLLRWANRLWPRVDRPGTEIDPEMAIQ